MIGIIFDLLLKKKESVDDDDDGDDDDDDDAHPLGSHQYVIPS